MDPMFVIWFVTSMAVFLAGLFIYRKALRLQMSIGFGSMTNELNVSEISKVDDEWKKMTALYNDSLLKIDQLTQDSDQKIRELQERLDVSEQQRQESAAKDEAIRLLKGEQDKFRMQLVEEKKYSEQTSEDYRNQLRNLSQILNQSKSDYEIAIHEKEIAVNRLIKEKEELAASCQDFSARAAQFEAQLQESMQAMQVLKNDSAQRLSVDDEDSKNALQKSIVLVKELKADNDALSESSKTLKQNVEHLEAANQNLEDKEQQLQYELVKSRAQLLGLEQTCEELKKKIEQLTAVEKK